MIIINYTNFNYTNNFSPIEVHYESGRVIKCVILHNYLNLK